MRKIFGLVFVIVFLLGCKDFSTIYDIRGTWVSTTIEDGVKVYQEIIIKDSEDQPEKEFNDKGKELKPTSIYYDYDWKVYYNDVLQDGREDEGYSEKISNKCHAGNAQVVFKEFISVFQPDDGGDIVSRNFILKIDGTYLVLAEYDATKGTGFKTIFLKQPDEIK